jgi:hypothetical protein
MKPEKLLLELEEIIEKLGYTIRKERGNFKGGFCVLEGEKIIMINKNHPVDVQGNLIVRFLHSCDLTDIFIKPAVRREMESKWKKWRLHDTSESGLFNGEPG